MKKRIVSFLSQTLTRLLERYPVLVHAIVPIGLVLFLIIFFTPIMLFNIAYGRLGPEGKRVLSWTLWAIVGISALVACFAFPNFIRRYASGAALGFGLISAELAPEVISEKEFFSVVAQIIPVLFLAAAIDARHYRNHRSGKNDGGLEFIDQLNFAILLLFLFAAEVDSLGVVASGNPTGYAKRVVGALTGAAFLLLVIGIVGPPEPGPGPESGRHDDN